MSEGIPPSPENGCVTAAAGAESEARGSDDETVDRRSVNPVQKTCSCTNDYVGTMRAYLIMAWLQQQLARERPDTFRRTAVVRTTKSLARAGQVIHF